jgi:site-specific DNA recombinase
MTPRKPSSSKPAAAYLRLSVATDDSVSITAQETLVGEEARRRGWGEPVLFVDEGVSGSKDVKRPDRDAMEARIAAGEFSALIVKSVDRLARSTADFARIVATCKRAGTALVVTDLGVDTSSPGGGMVLDVLAALASFEAAMIGARVKAGNVEKIRQGRALGGPVPFHLRNVPRDGGGMVRVVDEEKAPVAKEIIERLLAGESFRGIAVDLNRRGIAAPRRGKAWTSSTVRQVASNPAVAGMARRLGDLVRGDDGLPVVDTATALIDLPTWERLRAVVDGRSPTFKPRLVESERMLLDGLAVCATCGGRMARSSSQGGRYVSYSCSRGVTGGCTDRAAISERTLDAHVAAAYLEGIGDEEVVEVTREVDPRVTQERALLAAEDSAVTARLATAGAAEVADLAGRLADLRRRQDALRDEEPLAVVKGTGETYRQRWDREDRAGRRQMLADAIDRVVVAKGRGPARIEVRFGW